MTTSTDSIITWPHEEGIFCVHTPENTYEVSGRLEAQRLAEICKYPDGTWAPVSALHGDFYGQGPEDPDYAEGEWVGLADVIDKPKKGTDPRKKIMHYAVEDFGGAQKLTLYLRKAEALRAFRETPLPLGTGRFLLQGNFVPGEGETPRCLGEQYLLAEAIGGAYKGAEDGFLTYYHR